MEIKMKNFSHFRLIILAWLAVLIGLTVIQITKIHKTIIIAISLIFKTIPNKEMNIGLILVNNIIISNNKMTSILGITRDIKTRIKLNLTNINSQTILKINCKTRWANSRDIQWVNFQANRQYKSSFIYLRIICKTSQITTILKIT